MLDFVLELLKISLPAFIVLAAVIFLSRSFLETLQKALDKNDQTVVKFLSNEAQIRLVDLRHKQTQAISTLRLQAYERMTLFCSRIELGQIISRLDLQGMQANQLRMLIKLSVEEELQHNITQQIYMTDELWQMILLSKKEVESIADAIYRKVGSEASGEDYLQGLDAYLSEEPQIGYIQAQQGIKKEIQQLF